MTEAESAHMTQDDRRGGGQLIVESLRQHGVDLAFAVPGESYLEVLDALVDPPEVKLITCRQESGAAFMAEAYAKLTGRTGVAMVTRGPGACNAAIGVHTAFQDSTPLVLLVGQVGLAHQGREAFQEIDYRRMFAPVAKHALQIDQVERIPEQIAQAFHIARSGRPGPVVVALPDDMLRCRAAVAPPRAGKRIAPAPDFEDLAQLRCLLAGAARPMIIVGGNWSDEAALALAAFATANRVPVACAFRRQDIVNNDLPCYIGDLSTGPSPDLLARVRAADLILAIGTRLGEITTQGYSLLTPPDIGKVLIHVHPSAEELGRVFRPDLAIAASVDRFAVALADLPPIPDPVWSDWAAAARAAFEDWQTPPPSPSALDLGACMRHLRDSLPESAIVTVDAGNFSGWPQRFLRWRRPGRLLGPISGAMGYGIPAGVAAALVYPKRTVVTCVGDGGFLMTGQELATAMQHGARPIILVFDNGMYGTIRMHQEQRFPGRISGTTLTNPDFAAYARSFGAFGASVATTDAFAPAFAAARAHVQAHDGPAVLHLKMDPAQITTRTRLDSPPAGA